MYINVAHHLDTRERHVLIITPEIGISVCSADHIQRKLYYIHSEMAQQSTPHFLSRNQLHTFSLTDSTHMMDCVDLLEGRRGMACAQHRHEAPIQRHAPSRDKRRDLPRTTTHVEHSNMAAQKATEGAFELISRLTGMEKSLVPVAAVMACCVAAPGSIVPCVLVHVSVCVC